MFFSLATSIYQNYKLESEIQNFTAEIDNLADMAHQKPEDVKYFASAEYKDRSAKESFGLLNPGEKLIIIPDEQQVVEIGPAPLMLDTMAPSSVLSLSNAKQWWEYFFGQTLSVKVPEAKKVITEPVEGDNSEEDVELEG